MISTEKSHLPVVALTHPGMSGKNNEDRYGVAAFELSAKRPTPVLLAVLCDGIGGHRAGEVAAELAVNRITGRVADSDGSQPVETMRAAMELASNEIYAQAQADPERQGMGATCSCAWIVYNRLYTATVGDSRIYLVRGESIRQLSIDHTWIQEALERGLLQPNQARNHPNAHVIRRYLGSPAPPAVDFRLNLFGTESEAQALANQGTPLQEGDCLLLCSDGLTDLVEDSEILAAVKQQPAETAVGYLVDLANQRGGHDNITVVAIQVPVGAFRQRVPVRRGLIAALAGIGLLAILGVILAVSLGQPPGGGTPTQPAQPSQLPLPTVAQSSPLPSGATPTTGPVQSTPAPGITIQPTSALTQFVLPTVPGPTLTAWPTNTVRP